MGTLSRSIEISKNISTYELIARVKCCVIFDCVTILAALLPALARIGKKSNLLSLSVVSSLERP